MSNLLNTRAGEWYALAVNTGAEKRTRERILGRLSKQKLPLNDIQIIIKEETQISVAKNGEKVQSQVITLPGYLLIHVRRRLDEDVMNSLLSNILRVNGVLQFVGGGDRPLPLSLAEVEQIVGAQPKGPSSTASRTVASAFEVGDLVRIIDGPMTDFTGEVIEVKDSQGKVVIDVEVFGRSTKVEAPYSQIRKEH